MLEEQDIIHAEIDLIVQSGVLGRSPVYARLLRYLAAATAEHRTASEIEIATDVFRKGGEFDSNQDSSIRVYVHNLRQKLDRFYENNTVSKNRVSIPKGEYRLSCGVIEADVDGSLNKARSPRVLYALYAIAALLACNLALMGAYFSTDDSPTAAIAKSSVWAPILEGQRPLLVVVGDYFIFGELDAYGRISRMVREFNVNSPADLAALQDIQASPDARYLNLDLSYLPQSMAFALNNVLSVVHSQHKLVNIIPASKLRTSDLKSNDILYVGYLSALGILESYVFAASKLQIGNTYDELANAATGEYYQSNAGIPGRKNYQDFAYLATLPGPGADNHILVAGGTRDAGLMFMAEALSSAARTRELSQRMQTFYDSQIGSYEALYKVVGADRQSLDATLVHDAALDGKQIWSGDPL